MLQKGIRRGGVTLALILGLSLAGAAPAAAAKETGWSQAWGWLTSLVQLSGWTIDLSGNPADHSAVNLQPTWQMEDSGSGQPPGGPTIQEGPGFDPNGLK